MNPKELHFDSDGRKKLLSGIKQIAKAVKSTLGPRGNTVLIESQEHTGGITVTKDGVTVAKSINLLDSVENLAVRIMKEAADKTATSAGDGTTTAIVLTEALVTNAVEYFEDNIANRTEVLKLLQSECETIIKKLKKDSKKITGKKLKDVAVISANNDEEIGELIYKVYSEVGKDGIVTVEKSKNHETYYDNASNGECIINETYDISSEHKDKTINAGDDKKEESVNWQNCCYVSYRDGIFHHCLEEEKITNTSNHSINKMENCEDEAKMTKTHLPSFLSSPARPGKTRIPHPSLHLIHPVYPLQPYLLATLFVNHIGFLIRGIQP